LIGPNQGESRRNSTSTTLDARIWKRREERIVNELLLLRPTIICLQEISLDSLNSPGFQRLADIGYVCAGFSKTYTDIYNPDIPHSTIGVATFVQQEKIGIISSNTVALGFVIFSCDFYIG
jgi:mRNA deadenylase 3'-5' endonuclease subunit Ccr4